MITIFVLSFVLAVSTVSAQPYVNSNPSFVKEGTKAYQCTTPGGRKITCNRWEFPAKSGWKRFCTGQRSPFSKLADSEGKRVAMEPAFSGCSILFDEAWSDTRNLAKKGKALRREQTRALKPAEFSQKVQIKVEGLYLLTGCMAFHPGIEIANAPAEEQFNTNGIRVELREWHQSFSTPKIHAMLPSKAKFGPINDPVGLGDFDLIIPTWADMPPGDPSPGVTIGVLETNEVLTTDNRVRAVYQGTSRPGYYIDGLDGHCGLHMAYHAPGAPAVDGSWTCHQAYVGLKPGFYALVGVVSPYLSSIGNGEYLSGYDGYGGISHISLTFEEGTGP